jgi:hypothetical protein
LQTVVLCWHPRVVLQKSLVQSSLSLQFTGTYEQPRLFLLINIFFFQHQYTPVVLRQLSVVQALLSLQDIGANTHPVLVLQLSVVQALLSLQVICW